MCKITYVSSTLSDPKSTVQLTSVVKLKGVFHCSLFLPKENKMTDSQTEQELPRLTKNNQPTKKTPFQYWPTYSSSANSKSFKVETTM